jgi:crotonobetainyl-CoA:carnitine CoA-transferase CaiB-like acyl-CoA transferase
LLSDERFATNAQRVKSRESLDNIIAAAIGAMTMQNLRERLSAFEVGFSPINDIADVFAEPHFVAREAIVSVQDDELGNVRMQNVVPRFSATPGEVRSAGPALGAHNDEVWTELGFTSQQIALMRERKVI